MAKKFEFYVVTRWQLVRSVIIVDTTTLTDADSVADADADADAVLFRIGAFSQQNFLALNKARD